MTIAEALLRDIRDESCGLCLVVAAKSFSMSICIRANEIKNEKSVYQISDFSFSQSRVFDILQSVLTREHCSRWCTLPAHAAL